MDLESLLRLFWQGFGGLQEIANSMVDFCLMTLEERFILNWRLAFSILFAKLLRTSKQGIMLGVGRVLIVLWTLLTQVVDVGRSLVDRRKLREM